MAAEVVGDLAGPLIRRRGAAIRCGGNTQHAHASVRHRLQLQTQGNRLRSGRPRMQDLVLRPFRLHAWISAPEQLDTQASASDIARQTTIALERNKRRNM